MAKICRDCTYYREQGMMDINIPGEGRWCSNSQSPNYRTRPAESDTCPGFYLRGKKAPAKIRLANKALGLALKSGNAIASRKQRKRHKKARS